MSDVVVDGPQGPGRLTVAAADHARTVLLLGHGAGGGIDSFDLVALADGLPAHGVVVVRHTQPWREAGRRVAGRPATLDEAWAPAVAEVARRWPDLPLLVGGRSAGARVACRWAAEHAVAGVVALSFPLHPPGRPESSRAAELAGAAAPALVVQGAKDPFGTPAEVRDAVTAAPQAGEREVVEVPGTHDLGPRRKADDPDALADGLVQAVLAWSQRWG